MFNFKSQLLGAAAVLPIVAAGFLGSAGSAEAAALIGDFSFNGGTTVNPFASSTVKLTKDALYFEPQPITPVAIASQSGDFSSFNSANIGNIISFSGDTADNPFLDLGNLTIPGIILPAESTASLTDSLNTFTLESSDYKVSQSGANVSIDVELWGFFTSATGEISKGAGNITFQKNNTNVTDVNTLLNGGGTLTTASGSGMTFSGAAFTATSTPEPTTMLGLGLVAAGMTVARRRKLVKA
ncbi:PEP-CTERM sorting domain-containing protein [Anabaena sp. PCC 7108]|uniref:PEP-CTERM sorting domain-containing protein n=1 Tax=Anabaena sp. PCC 7108 TaxID=163908 RepID=UPI00034B2422|nr:PEP-CTERM sorting domain-containing protein [Anabaena sp. PCC 7108]